MGQQSHSDESAQSPQIHLVDITVTSISGSNVFIDAGRESGLQVGDPVEFQRDNGRRVSVIVDSVSRRNARCLSNQNDPSIAVGDKGKATIRVASDPPAELVPLPKNNSGIVEASHPSAQWTLPPEQWNSSQPLLAPSRSLRSDEREPHFHGYVFGQYLNTWNWQFVDNQYSLGRLGTDFWIDNPFKQGGGFHFRGDMDWRGTNIFDGQNSFDTLGRIDLMSYYLGDTEREPFRFEIGRFLPNRYPEFGFLDGVEYSGQLNSRNRVGLSLGALPEPFATLPSGEDLQAAVFYEFCSGSEERVFFGMGYQKTWHDGIPDRDLIVTKAQLRPNDRFRASATLWTDYYADADSLKPGGFELTEALFNQQFQLTPRMGVGSYYTQIKWPELLRREIDPIFNLQIIRNRRRNYGGHTWFDVSPRVRLNGRIDLWENEDSFGGTTWETEMVVRRVLDAPLDLSFAFLTTDGIYSSGPGGRVSLSHYFSRGTATVTYTVGDYRLTEESDKIIHQAIMTSLDFYNANGRSVSVYGDYRFGEVQDAASLGIILRQRFR